MASVYDVAQYVRNHFAVLTKVKLQKLLYYCQAWTLAWDDKPLFDADFEAWERGPVVRELHESMHDHQSYVPLDIENASINNLTEQDVQNIEDVLVTYADMSADTLVALTHSERPWLDTWDVNTPKKVIPQNSIKEFYRGLMNGEE